MTRRTADDLQDDADDDVLIVSDGLASRLEGAGLDQPLEVICAIYYEIPSAGIAGKLVRLRKTASSIQVGLEVPHESIGESLSCPEFIRLVITTGDALAYEMDFVEHWAEESRELVSKDGHVELHISLVEHDT